MVANINQDQTATLGARAVLSEFILFAKFASKEYKLIGTQVTIVMNDGDKSKKLVLYILLGPR